MIDPDGEIEDGPQILGQFGGRLHLLVHGHLAGHEHVHDGGRHEKINLALGRVHRVTGGRAGGVKLDVHSGVLPRGLDEGRGDHIGRGARTERGHLVELLGRARGRVQHQPGCQQGARPQQGQHTRND